MTPHVLVLGMDEGDALDSLLASPKIASYRKAGAHISIVWPGAFQRIADSAPFDKLLVTLRVSAHPDTTLRDNWVAACCTRVRGSDGKTAAERLTDA